MCGIQDEQLEPWRLFLLITKAADGVLTSDPVMKVSWDLLNISSTETDSTND